MEYLSTLKLTSVDYFTLGMLLISALVGISRGLFKEVLALASWLAAAWVAYHYSNYLSTEWLSTFHLEELLSLGISFLILFILMLIICGLFGGVVQKIILSVGLSLTDRFLGLIFWRHSWWLDCCGACHIGSPHSHSEKHDLEKCHYQAGN